MQLITIDEILVGDEIIISGNSKLKYLKVLKKPVLKRNNGWRRDFSDGILKWEHDAPVYSSIRCTTRQDTIEYKTRTGSKASYKEYVYEPDISKHNVRININLYGRDILLVKREQN